MLFDAIATKTVRKYEKLKSLYQIKAYLSVNNVLHEILT